MQGVVRSFDPDSGEGIIVRDTDRLDIVLSPDALEGSLFRSLRQGQRVNFDLDPEGRASRVRSGAERDLGLPDQVQI